MECARGVLLQDIDDRYMRECEKPVLTASVTLLREEDREEKSSTDGQNSSKAWYISILALHRERPQLHAASRQIISSDRCTHRTHHRPKRKLTATGPSILSMSGKPC